MITSKIPKEVLTQLEIQRWGRNRWTVKELREHFNNYVAARERAEQQFVTGKGETTRDCNKPMISSAEALVVGTQAVGGKGEMKSSKKNVDSVMHNTGAMNV